MKPRSVTPATYVGALPGRIIQSIKQAGTNNLFMMDEVDKLALTFGETRLRPCWRFLTRSRIMPSAIIISTFPMTSLSDVHHTGNITDPIPPLSRTGWRSLTSRIHRNRKVEDCHDLSFARQMEENGIDQRFSISPTGHSSDHLAIHQEAGLRNLERELASVCRKVARKVAEGKKEKTKINAKTSISSWAPYFLPTKRGSKRGGRSHRPGLDRDGSEILQVEASTTPGRERSFLRPSGRCDEGVGPGCVDLCPFKG